YGQTDVVVYKDKTLKSLIKESEIGEIIQTTPIKSVDIDDDGIIEVVKMQFIDKLDKEKASANNFVKNYYKITEALELDLVSQLYEDIDMNVNITFPISFKDNFFIDKTVGDNKISIYFSPDKSGIESLFMLIEKVDKTQLDSFLGEYQLITEMDNMAIIAKIMDVPPNLRSKEKGIYEKMRYDAQDLTLIIKPANL
ncbi:MAG: hypothetical protein WBH44_01455, partial [Proteocatella sp.]